MGAIVAAIGRPPCWPFHSKTGGATHSLPFFHGLLAVDARVRKVLTRFGDEWIKAGADGRQQGIVARWGWLVITDIGRNDLFGEPREMPDKFEGDVDVPRP